MGAKNGILRCVELRRGLVMAIGVAIVLGMLAGPLTQPVAAQRPSCDTSYTEVYFLGETCVGTTCTWWYQVCQHGFALSHWVIGLCPCFKDHIVELAYVDAQDNKTVLPECTERQTTPCWEFGLDPTTGLFGLKWDNLPGPENECWTFYLIIDQNRAEGAVNWTSKFAACDPGGGTVTGPTCPCGCGEIIAFKYYDVNQNGVYDYQQPGEENPVGDYPLEGWEICLDDGSNVTCNTTDENGFVDFGCLSPGNYTLCETPGGNGWVNSQPGVDPPCYNVTLQAGQQRRLHFGNYDPKPEPAYIRAGKYYDYNQDGQCNGPCGPLNDWEICLNDGDNITCKITHDYCMLCGGCTDYWVVPRGNYTLCEKLKSGWVNSDPGVAPYCKEVTVEGGEFRCVPFGNWEPPPVGGEACPVDKVGLIAPWIVLAAGVIIGVSLVVVRRRRAQS